MMRLFPRRLACLLLICALAACQQKPSGPPSAQVKIGKPYSIDGKTYYPAYDPTYDKIGDASWYGPGFHGKYTASGEQFDQDDMTAAHPTLPMPSIVRVTNLTNGKSLLVRINDRGPFKSNRIIDLSRKSAEKLGIRSTTQVRVQYLQKETDEYIASLQSGKPTEMARINNDAEMAKDASVNRSTEPEGQIVETAVVESHGGQAISSAAPVMSVSQQEVTAAPKTEVVQPPVKVETVAGDAPAIAPQATLVKEAWADDNKSLPSPPPGEASSSDTRVTKEVKREAQDTPPSRRREPLPTASSGHYLIQVGSFAAEENARKLAGKLQQVGNIAVDKVEMPGKIWWRVRVGPFEDKGNADEALTKVRANGLPDARIVRL